MEVVYNFTYRTFHQTSRGFSQLWVRVERQNCAKTLKLTKQYCLNDNAKNEILMTNIFIM